MTTDTPSAGALLRQAREAQGLHVAALAATVKVAPAKIEALEADRYEALPDLTFTRALARTLCRVLHVDERPVLERLPGADLSRLDLADVSLNTPFRDRPRAVDPAEWTPWRRPVPWVVVLLLAAAAAFVWLPMPLDLNSRLSANGASVGAGGASAPVLPPSTTTVTESATAMPGAGGTAVPATSAETGSTAAGVGATVAAGATTALPSAAPASAAALVVADVAAGSAGAAGAAAAAQAPGAADVAVLRAVQDTWVQASDGAGQVLMARLVPAGETVELTGTLPLKLRIGNVAGTELSWRGQPVSLASPRRDNVLSLQLPPTP